MSFQELLDMLFDRNMTLCFWLPWPSKTVPLRHNVHDCYLLLSTAEGVVEIKPDKLCTDMTKEELADFGFSEGITFAFKTDQDRKT